MESLNRYLCMKRSSLSLLFLQVMMLGSAQDTTKLALYFPFNASDLSKANKGKVDSLLKAEVVYEISIVAHCDSVGSDLYNDELAFKRAQSIKFYLIEKGMDLGSVSIRAVGKREPLNDNSTEQDRAINRRVDLVCSVKARPKTVVNSRSTAIADAQVGETIKLQNIQFVPGRHKIVPSSHETLLALLKTLKENPKLRIEVQGHICCQNLSDGLDEDTGTLNLSVNRAKAIYDYLIQNGIDASRLQYKGFAGSRKLVEENSEADANINRRVEIMILGR